jgi:tetratricopeptide (TPR) repeat protein
LAEGWTVLAVCLFLVAVIWVVFGRTTRFGFVNYDDGTYVSDNALVTGGLTPRGVAWAWTHVICNFYHPLTMLSLMLDFQFHKLNAGGYHLTNVLIHTASSVLLFLVLRRMTGALWRSAFVAAVFAIHPLRAESVAWVTERKDVLGAFFFMLTLGAYVRYARKPNSLGRYLAVVALFGLGLLCKPTAVTLPFVLLLLDYWPLGRMGGMKNLEFRMQNGERGEHGRPGVPFWGLVREKIPLLALAAVSCVVAYFAQGKAVESVAYASIPTRIGNVLISYVVYLRQLVWPADLAVYYPYPQKSPALGEVALAFLLLAVISAGVLASFRKRPWLLTGWLWYLGMLVPVIGIVLVTPTAHGDRNTYLPHIGLAVLLTWAVCDISAGWRHRRALLGALAAGALVALVLLARAQTSYWHDSESLWRRALDRTSDNPAAHNGLATALRDKGDVDGAIAEYRKALALNPYYGESFVNLGVALALKGDLDGAIAQYQQALQIKPDYMEAHFDLGTALGLKGSLDEAVAQFRKVLELRPDYPRADYNLGKVLLLKGDLDPAMDCLAKTTAVSQDPLANWYNFGNQFVQERDWQCAIVCYRQATKINPRFADAYANLGVALSQKGETKEALDSWQKALEINPGQLYVQNNLAWSLATTADASLRNGAKAVALAQQAEHLSGGGNPAILRTLAAAYAETGDYASAASTARRALQLAVAQKNEGLAATLQKEIQLYDAAKPARETPP